MKFAATCFISVGLFGFTLQYYYSGDYVTAFNYGCIWLGVVGWGISAE
jgi:hypothetical protein